MRKITIALFITFIGMLLVPATSSFSSGGIIQGSVVLQTVREQRLRDLYENTEVGIASELYRSYDDMTEDLHRLAMDYSHIMSLASLGTTYEGRDLWFVKISDNVSQVEDEPGVLFMGAHHGNEKPSYEVCLFFIEYLLEHYTNTSLPEVRDAVDSTQIYVIPMVNPDGVEAGTRKNRTPNHGSFGRATEITSIGVDLNRNYGYRWFRYFLLIPFYRGATSLFDKSEAYRGAQPFSENETQAIQQFMQTHEITLSISYHTYGGLILYPWGYTILPPKDRLVFISIGENISQINDYIWSQSVYLYPTVGDACDWMYATYGVYAFTIELGESFAPDDPVLLQEMYLNHTTVNLYVCQRALSI
jgi:carboxypeptidase T